MPLGDGRFDSGVAAGRRAPLEPRRRCVRLWRRSRARSGTVVSAVMFGAIAASGVLPFRARRLRRRHRRAGPCRRGEPRGIRARMRGDGGEGSRRSNTTCHGRDGSCSARCGQRGFSAVDARHHCARAASASWSSRIARTPISISTGLQRVLAAERVADPSGERGFRADARDGALSRAVDGVRRRRPRRRSQIPGEPLRARPARSRRRRIRRRADHRLHEAGSARNSRHCCRHGSPRAWRRGIAGARHGAGAHSRSRSRCAPTA